MSKYTIIQFLFLLVLLLFGSSSYAIEEIAKQDIFASAEIKDGSTLTLKECISTAFRNSPNIKRKKYELDLAEANVGIAKSVSIMKIIQIIQDIILIIKIFQPLPLL